MATPTRDRLEQAARTFFANLAKDVDQPRHFPADGYRQAIAYNVHLTEERIAELDRQLISNTFDADVALSAASMLRGLGHIDDLDADADLLAQSLAARALRQQMLYLLHRLRNPVAGFEPDDPAFVDKGSPASAVQLDAPAAARPTITAPAGQALGVLAEEFLRKKALLGVGHSQIDETARLLKWLREQLGEERAIGSITKEELRKFRDDLQRVNVKLRGRLGPFRDRLTNVADDQVKSATYLRYWNAAKGFFAWCLSEGYVDADPSQGLKIDKRKGESKRTPPPFTRGELQLLFKTPLYAGYKSARRLREVGDRHVREGHWWAAVLLLHTGMRAGELSQLLPDDFVFEAEVPHVKIREEDDAGRRVKTTKNEASVRDVPLHPRLTTLGLREFVGQRRKKYPKARVFQEFRLGTRGRISDGMTRFWRDYLKDSGLWKDGRGTHVFRHTVVACLRANGAAEEDIGAFVGHTGRTVTSGYGGAYPLSRKAKTAELLDYGFDVVEVLGGAFDPERHI